MNGVHDDLDGLARVLRLTEALADQILGAGSAGQAVPQDQLIAIAKAARLLHEHGVEWPPLVEQAVRELARREDVPSPVELPPEPAVSEGMVQAVGRGLARFFAKPRHQAGEP